MAEAVLKIGRFGRDSLHQEIVEGLKALPTLMREVFVRSHYQAYSLSEIARELELPVSTVEGLLASADEIFYRRIHKFRI